jgi:mono/diheme cytochrome c family protein
MKKKIILSIVGGLVILAVLVQFVPLPGRGNNPAVVAEPAWDRPQTRALAKRACFDCHSNETTWPWFSYMAPFSWLIYKDVVDGRSRLNFSEWNGVQRSGLEAAEMVQSGEMPPFYYLPLHPSAQLSAAEKQQLITGFNNTIK